jgi:hypothetical protein
MNGKTVSLSDPKFKTRWWSFPFSKLGVRTVSTKQPILSPWYKQNKERGVEIVGLAFERKVIRHM